MNDAELTTYRARDRRVYNGALCSDMQREANHTAALEKRMKKAEPTAGCTYFPSEQKWLVFVGYRPLTDNFHDGEQAALIEAIKVLEGKTR